MRRQHPCALLPEILPLETAIGLRTHPPDRDKSGLLILPTNPMLFRCGFNRN